MAQGGSGFPFSPPWTCGNLLWESSSSYLAHFGGFPLLMVGKNTSCVLVLLFDLSRPFCGSLARASTQDCRGPPGPAGTAPNYGSDTSRKYAKCLMRLGEGSPRNREAWEPSPGQSWGLGLLGLGLGI